MNETLLTEGRFIRNAFLPQRRRVAIENLTSNSEHDKEVELVSRDTAYPEGNIYDEVIVDSQKGKQHLRVVRTTKPYNPDFTVSAQTLTFILPDADYSRRIVTPQEGDRESWKRFMEINKTSAEVMVNYYKEQGMENFLVLIGGSFNPYTDKNVLRTQSVKTAHVHTLLISDAYLQEAVQFHSSLDFRKFLSQGVRTPDEIRMDYRRFFHSHINDYFNLIVSRTFLDCLNRKKYSDFTMNNLEEPNTRFPLNGIRFTTDGLDFLSSSDFVDMIKTTGEEIEKMLHDNLLASIYSCKYAQIVKGGHILNIGSSVYAKGRSNFAIYSSSKAALVNFSEAFAEENPDLFVNVLSPCRTNTPMRRKSFPSENSDLLLQPEEVAAKARDILLSKVSCQHVVMEKKK